MYMVYGREKSWGAAGAKGMGIWGSAWWHGIMHPNADLPGLWTPSQTIDTRCIHIGRSKREV
jgi:hypothetical protein